MDTVNQQVSSQQLAWLAGIWDGEGTFTISCTNKDKGKFHLSHQITLTNSCPIMINEIAKIIDHYGISSHLWREELRTMKHKRCYHLTIRKQDGVKKFIELVLPYLISKKAQAEILYRFVLSREKYRPIVKQDEKGRLLGKVTQGYTEEELSLHDQIKRLNLRGMAREP